MYTTHAWSKAVTVMLLAMAAATASASWADESTIGSAVAGHPAPYQETTADATPADTGNSAEREESDDAASRGQQMLSTLGALMLGVLGLVWMRRHAAEH